MPKRLHYACYVIAGYLILVVLMAALGARTALTAPGSFLFDKFHMAALYVPSMILVCGASWGAGRFPRRTRLILCVSPALFLTAATAFQVAAGRADLLASGTLIDAFGRVPATGLFLLLLALETAAMVKLAVRYPDPEDGLIDFTDLSARLREFTAFLGLREAEEDRKPSDDAPAAGSEEPTLEDRPSMAFPSFPEAPEPIDDSPIPADFFRKAPEKPAHPAADSVDSDLSDLLRRTLKGSGSAPERRLSPSEDTAAPLPEASPAASAFPPPADLTPVPEPFHRDSSPDKALQEADSDPAWAEDPPASRSDAPSLGELDPAFAFLAGGEFPLEEGPADGPEGNDSVSASEAGTQEDRREEDDWDFMDDAFDPAPGAAADRIVGETPEEDLPEEERDLGDISGKLDPQGTGPKGVVAPTKTKAKSRPRRKKRYEVPVDGLLADYPDADFASIDESTRRGAEVLEQTLKEFKIEAKVTGIRRGPVITMYELLPSPGVKISSIVNLQDNIALRLAASRVRFVAPIPGKHAIGIEVPNKKRAIVSFSSMVESEEFRESDAGIPVILGKDIGGGNQVIDLTRTPHLLIAGATGAGKSVCVNSLIASILYSRTPRDVKMIMVDPKIVELKLYNDIPHLLTPVITEPKRALQALQWCLCEMERRYSLLDTQGVRDIKTFNKRVKDRKLATEPLPYIVVIVDEFADLMATSGKELEGIVARLAAMSRAVGIHLVLATQRPSVDVITGLIKANFPSRIAFMVAQKTDSRIIIDAMGAEKLLGRGDMLFTSAWDPFPARMQGAFLAEEEVERLAEHVKTLGEPEYLDEEMFFDEEDDEDFHLESDSGDDPMYEKALEIVVSSRKASASYLQRRLKVGYNRAARLVEEMERRGIVGPANGSKPRDLIHVPERFSSPVAEDREPSSA